MSKKRIPINKAISDLHPYELWLIKRIREKYRYGEITVKIKKGVPMRIRKGYVDDDPRDEEIIYEL